MSDANEPNPDVEPPNGVAEKYLCRIEGPDGPCYIAAVGGMPEREDAFVYRDRDYSFYFYVRSRWEGNVYDVDVENATVSKFTGPKPSIRARDFDRVAANMRSFFEQRSFVFPSRARPAAEQFRNLTFSWKVVR